jgi:hypothetical protein
MVGFWEAVLGGVFALVALWAGHRLLAISNGFLALRGTSSPDGSRLEDGQPVAIEGTVYVDEPAVAATRLFDSAEGTVGAYIWHAWFPDAGRYTYDSDRGELRQGRNTFAAGLAAGRIGITSGGRDLDLEFDWYDELYGNDPLEGLEVGDPAQSTKLPTVVTRYVWDSVYVSLQSTIGDCSVDRLTDIVDLSGDDVAAEEFSLSARGITAGTELFVHGELRRRDGKHVIVGTDATPLLVSDTGRGGLIRQLRWRAVKYTLALFGAVALGAVFVL